MNTEIKAVDLKRIPTTGLVFEVTYIMNFELEGEVDRKIGKIEFQGDPNDPNFIPYNNLTEETVTGWVTQALGQDEINSIEAEFEAELQARVDAKANPQHLSGTPWGN
jgi:hypothetical protein